MSGLPAAPDKFTSTRSTERGMAERMSSELRSVLDARLPRQGGTSAGQVYVYKRNCDPDMAELRNGFASEVSARNARGDRESLSVHPSWLRSDTDPRGELDTFKVLVKFECITSDESAGTKRQTNGRSYLWCYPLLLSAGELSAQWWRSLCLRYGNIRLNIHPPCRVTFLNFQTRSPARRLCRSGFRPSASGR